MSKSRFTNQAMMAATELAQALERLRAIHATFFARGYNDAGVDPITNSDTDNEGITAATLQALIVSSENVLQFVGLVDGTGTAGDHYTTLNKARKDI